MIYLISLCFDRQQTKNPSQPIFIQNKMSLSNHTLSLCFSLLVIYYGLQKQCSSINTTLNTQNLDFWKAQFFDLSFRLSSCDFTLDFYEMDLTVTSAAWDTLFPYAYDLAGEPQVLWNFLACMITLDLPGILLPIYRKVTKSRATVLSLLAEASLKTPEKITKLSNKFLDEYNEADQWYQVSEKFFAYSK
jgi:hypothetical protein